MGRQQAIDNVMDIRQVSILVKLFFHVLGQRTLVPEKQL